MSETIAFDVLLRGAADDVSVAPADIDALKPPPESIERCFRWLTAQGITCHRTDFGLACESEIDLFQSVFQVEVDSDQPRPDTPATYHLRGELRVPPEIEPLVLQVTIAQPPAFFGA